MQILKRLNPQDTAAPGKLDPKLFFINSLIAEMRHVAMNHTIIESGYQTVYDVPCGYTQRVFEMTDLGKDYVGGDLPLVIESIEPIIGDMLEPDKKKLVRFACVDVTNFSRLEAAVADVDGEVCIATEGLSVYLNMDEKVQLYKNMRRLLAQKGGCWLTADPETLSYYWTVLLALSEDEEKARQIFASITQKFSSQSNTDLNAINKKSLQISGSGYTEMIKIYEKYGLSVERIPYYREDFHLNLFAKMTPQQKERLMENLKDVHIWKLTANPDFDEDKKRGSNPENEKVYREENCSVTVETVGSKLYVKLSGRIDSLSAPLFLKSWKEESAAHEIQEVEIDCSALEYISSAGLRVLIIIKKALTKSTVVLTDVTAGVKDILETTGFIDFFELN